MCQFVGLSAFGTDQYLRQKLRQHLLKVSVTPRQAMPRWGPRRALPSIDPCPSMPMAVSVALFGLSATHYSAG